jgi:A/G-specific adenine glycosylase
MLQQTRVATVISYFVRFVARFPDVRSLAEAPESDVLALWKGLGYYSRARNLQKAAQTVVREHGGRLPEDYDALRRLPGVGDYTAGAVRSIAFGLATPAVDGNVLRVLARFAGIDGDVALPATRRRIADLSAGLSPPGRAADFCEGLMELGATVCLPKAPDCAACPWRVACVAFAEGRTAELPVKRPKPPPERSERTALVVTDGAGRLLVEYREKGLLGGLWGFPEREPEDAFEARSGVRPDLVGARTAGVVEHVFTHRRWRMEVSVCGVAAETARAADGPRPGDGSDGPRATDGPKHPFRWVTEEEFEALPVSKAFQKVREVARVFTGG